MNERKDEEAVAKLLRACGLQPERYSERTPGKKPDFRVSGPSGELFICEVKSVRSTPDHAVTNDQLYGAITDDLRRAVKQFRAVNSAHLVPNVLAWVTHNPRYNVHTFADLVRGKIIVEGVEHGDLSKLRFGRFDTLFRHVDLFLWVFNWGKPEMFVNGAQARHARTLVRLLRSLSDQDCETSHEDGPAAH